LTKGLFQIKYYQLVLLRLHKIRFIRDNRSFDIKYVCCLQNLKVCFTAKKYFIIMPHLLTGTLTPKLKQNFAFL